jgi:hypothetical protein
MTQKLVIEMSREEREASRDRMVREANERSEADRRANPDKYRRTFRGAMRHPKPSDY